MTIRTYHLLLYNNSKQPSILTLNLIYHIQVRSFTAFSLSLFLTITTSLIDLASFSFILYSIQPQLFGTIILYSGFGTITTSLLGKKLIGLNYEKLQVRLCIL